MEEVAVKFEDLMFLLWFCRLSRGSWISLAFCFGSQVPTIVSVSVCETMLRREWAVVVLRRVCGSSRVPVILSYCHSVILSFCSRSVSVSVSLIPLPLGPDLSPLPFARPEPKLGHDKYNVVYERSTPELYDEWAADGYDATVAQQSVAVDSLVRLFLAAAPKGKPLTVLDAGCGTGRVAEVCVRDAGKHGVEVATCDGMDYSAGMLAVATSKGVYGRLLVADLTKELPRADFPSATYDAVLCSGVFLQGHVGPEALPELSRVLKPGGLLCFTVRPTFFDATKAEWLATLEAAGVDVVSIDMEDYAAGGFKAPMLTCRKRGAGK